MVFSIQYGRFRVAVSGIGRGYALRDLMRRQITVCNQESKANV
jgi:alanyl-tRNA synthetase